LLSAEIKSDKRCIYGDLMTFTIEQISTPDDISAASELVRSFTNWAIAQDPEAEDAPTFRDLENELATLPGVFGPPTGCFLLARDEKKPIGCVAFKAVGDNVVELKRMYVNPDQRGRGVGLKLVMELIARARALNSKRIVLDSYHTMHSAHQIYRAVGFKDVAAPVDFPKKLSMSVVFMEMDLQSASHP